MKPRRINTRAKTSASVSAAAPETDARQPRMEGIDDQERDRKELLELLFAHVAEAIFLVDAGGRIVEVNPAACAMTGYTHEELVGMHPWDFVTSASRDEILALMQRMERGMPVTVQRIFRRKTGDLRTMDLRVARFGCPERELFVASCRDLTEQKALEARLRDLNERRWAEEELRRLNTELSQQAAQLREINQTLVDSEQRLRLAIETGRIGLWVWNSADVTNSGDWSHRLKEIFGLPLNAEVTHDMFLKCVHPEDRERVDRSVMQALSGANGGEYRAEYRTIHPRDGSEHWVTARGQAFFNSEGQAIRFIGTVMDITERKLAEESSMRLNLELERHIKERTADLEQTNRALQVEIEQRKKAEEALKRSEDYLRMAIDTIPGLVWSALPDGHIEYLNKRWLDYTGLTPEQALGWGWLVAIHLDDVPGLVEYWKSILQAGEAGEYEARLRRFDGEFRWFLFRGVPLYDESGKLVKWYGTNTDIEALHASEHLARGQLNALIHTLDSLSQESDPDNLPRHVVNNILAQLGAFSVTIWERNGERLDLLGVTDEGAFRTRRQTEYFEGSIPVSGDAPPLWVEALQTGSHIVIEDIDTEVPHITLSDGRTAKWPKEVLTRPFANLKVHLAAQGVRGLLISPMTMAGRLAGIIGIRFAGTRVFQRPEIDLTKALAHQAMLSIQLMRLAQQSRRAAVVAERNRLARDIHDTLAQGFMGVIVQLEAAEDAQTKGLSGEAARHIEHASELARDSLQEARRSVHALRPQTLTESDLCVAMESLIRKMTTGTKLRAEFVTDGQPPPLPAGWEENLLRICQEALTNTLRHARAAHFKAHLAFNLEEIRLELNDDGIGFDPDSRWDGFGLLGIKERAEVMNARWKIESASGKGTTILIALPLAKQDPSSRL